FIYTPTAPTELYPLSLHDALPICPFPTTTPRPMAASCSTNRSDSTSCSPITASPQTACLQRCIWFPAATCSSTSIASCRIGRWRSEEHTSELQSQSNLVCRLLLEK